MKTKAWAALLAAALQFGPATAQTPESPLAHRELSEVTRARVVCDRQHFGRLVDLVVAVPSGQVTAAVVSLSGAAGERVVVVPYDRMKFAAADNLFVLGPCLDDEPEHGAPFDPTSVKVQQATDDGGAVSGHVLASRLGTGGVELTAGGKGSRQGLTLELSRGHTAFVHVAAATERAGDSQLHPVPWSALRFGCDEHGALTTSLPLTSTALAQKPTLVDVILQDPLHRPLVYKAFAVAPPAHDRG